jgi:hypothetical protein
VWQFAGDRTGITNSGGQPDPVELHYKRGRFRDLDGTGSENYDDSAHRFGHRFRRHTDPYL